MESAEKLFGDKRWFVYNYQTKQYLAWTDSSRTALGFLYAYCGWQGDYKGDIITLVGNFDIKTSSQLVRAAARSANDDRVDYYIIGFDD